jgi:HD-like signal output (HDOD) protein
MTRVDEIVSTLRSLEPLPQVAMRVMEISRKDDVVPRDLAAVVRTDAAITAKVLKLCNSAYYGFQREIASLDEASNLLGTRTLTNLVLTSCGGQYFRNFGESTESSREHLWERSVTIALAASILARLHGEVDKSRAYTVGLLQNIGHLVLDRFLHDERETILNEVRSGSPLLAAEENILGLHHAEVGARLAERWEFPEVLVDTIRHHHVPSAAKVDPELAAVVQMAEHVTTVREVGQGLGGLVAELAGYSLDLEGMGGLSIGELETMLSTEIERAREFVAA